MNIRPFEVGDSAAVIALWDACHLIAPQNDPLKDINRKLSVDPDLFLVGVLEYGKGMEQKEGDAVVATVMGGYDGHRGWVNYLAVSPSMRRRGYGRIMMEKIEVLLRARGCPKIKLQIRETNQAVIDFYNALGFATDKVISMGKRLERDH